MSFSVLRVDQSGWRRPCRASIAGDDWIVDYTRTSDWRYLRVGLQPQRQVRFHRWVDPAEMHGPARWQLIYRRLIGPQ